MNPTHEMTETLHVEARRYADFRKNEGAAFDKRHLRWNDIVSVGIFYGSTGLEYSHNLALSGVREAVDACVKGDPQYVEGRGPLTMIQPWMIRT